MHIFGQETVPERLRAEVPQFTTLALHHTVLLYGCLTFLCGFDDNVYGYTLSGLSQRFVVMTLTAMLRCTTVGGAKERNEPNSLVLL